MVSKVGLPTFHCIQRGVVSTECNRNRTLRRRAMFLQCRRPHNLISPSLICSPNLIMAMLSEIPYTSRLNRPPIRT